MAQHMMAYILNQNLETLDIVDGYESFIWTERFDECGDFSITVTPDSHVLSSLIYPNYLMLKGSDCLMCIEDYELNQKWQEGDFVTVTGRTIDSILDTRRVFYPLTFDNETVKTCIETILNQNVLAPSMPERKYSYIDYDAANSEGLSAIYTGEFYGEDVLEALHTLCEVAGVGIRMVPNYETRKFVLSFYSGTNRSSSQEIYSPVIFSPGYENLIGAKYYRSPLTIANASVTHGEDFGGFVKKPIYDDKSGAIIGYENEEFTMEIYAFADTLNARDRDRVEIVVDTQIPSESDTSIEYKSKDEYLEAAEKYRKLLEDACKIELGTYSITETFTGDIEPLRQFVYGRDFFLGDIVQVLDGYGHDGRVRVSEVVRSEDQNGYMITPTFVALE